MKEPGCGLHLSGSSGNNNDNVYTCTHIGPHSLGCTIACMKAHTHAHMHTQTLTNTHIHTCTHAHTHARTPARTHAHTTISNITKPNLHPLAVVMQWHNIYINTHIYITNIHKEEFLVHTPTDT